MAEFDSLEPSEVYGRLTDARYIQGGYFVVKEKADLSSDKEGFVYTGMVDAYSPYGTIVVGSLCYCQKERTHYMCTAIDAITKAVKWEEVTIGGGGVVSGGSTETEETETPTENLEFSRLSDGTYEVSGEKDPSDSTGCKTKNDYTNVVIPSTHNGASVTKIASHAFDGCDKLETVNIPDSITFIDEKAFHDCSSLKFVVIPRNVTNLGMDSSGRGGEVFRGCSSLEWVSIPKSVEKIGFYTFYGCTKATIYTEWKEKPIGWYSDESGVSWNPSGCSVLWGQYVEFIQSSTTTTYNGSIYNTSKGLLVNRLTIDGVCEIEGIGTCTDTTVVIPSTYKGRRIHSIGLNAFGNCSSIKTVIIDRGITRIYPKAFYLCQNLETAVIPDSVDDIGYRAFEGCTSLKDVHIPKSVEYMGSNAFYGVPSVACSATEELEYWSVNWYDAATTKVQWNVPQTTEERLKRLDDILYFLADKEGRDDDIAKAGLTFLYPH